MAGEQCERDNAIPQIHMSTKDVPTPEQFDAWRAMMAPPGEFSLAPDVSAADGFLAQRSIFDLGSVAVTTEQSPSVLFDFGPGTVRKSGLDHLFVGVIRSGGQLVECGDGVASTGPGGLVAFSMDQPRRGRSYGLEGVGVCIPRGVHPELAGIAAVPPSLKENAGMEGLLRDFLIVFGHHLPTLKPADRDRATKALILMISTCLEPSPDGLAGAHKIIGNVILEQARRHIRRNLSSPTLTVEEVCRVVGVSRAQLYRIFEPVGGVATEIRRQRLFASHDALCDRSDRRKVNQIAYDLGFSSADEFSRVFRREFGYSPKEARGKGRLGATWIDARIATSSFESMLKELGRS